MATPPTAPPPSLFASAPIAPPTPPAPRNRRRLTLGAVAAAAVVLLLVTFVVLPALSGPGGAAAVLTYSGALPVADGTVANFDGGGWTPLFAAGFDSATNESFPANATLFGNVSGCSYSATSGANGISLPSFAGNRSAGQSPAWAFAYRNGTDAIAIVAVINGHGTVIATVTGSSCGFYVGFLYAIPGNAIDSSRAATVVRPMAASFLAQYPNASAVFLLFGGAVTSFGGLPKQSEWSVGYSSCTIGASSNSTGAVFNATVNAVTGAVIAWHTNTSVPCGGSLTMAEHAPDVSGPGLFPMATVRENPSSGP
jgi:hypothetical protein